MAFTRTAGNGGNDVETANESNTWLELFKKTNKEKPEKADLAALGAFLADHPDAITRVGNLANQVEIKLLGRFDHSQVQLLTTGVYCRELRTELGHEKATPLEKGLIDHVVVCWLRLHICELDYQMYNRGVTLPLANYWEHKLSAHQKRYLRAVETLARVRKLNVSIQVNVAQNQIVTDCQPHGKD